MDSHKLRIGNLKFKSKKVVLTPVTACMNGHDA